MAGWDDSGLTLAQRAFVTRELGTADVIADLSWGLVETRVLRVAAGSAEYIVKAAGPGDHHLEREIAAHETATGPWRDRGLCSRMIAADRATRVLITTFLPGDLVLDTAAELDVDVHEQAGALLRAFHSQTSRRDNEYEARATAKATAWLRHDHRIPPDVADRARGILDAHSPQPVIVVPTHGDWQPRNWLIDRGVVRVIDFGRFDHRPPATDLCRLAAQQWSVRPELEEAFVAGYGGDPRDPELWRIDLLREAIGTAVWAHQVGDEPFEAQGHRMLASALARFA